MKRLMLLPLLLCSMVIFGQAAPAGVNVNDKAPLFTATTHLGKKVALADMLKEGPVVLFFYRGQWCPYCNKQMKGLQDSLQLFVDKGAQVLAITPETAESVGKTVEKTGAAFPIVPDAGLAIMKAYDVAFAVDEKTIEKYKTYGIDFTMNNGSNGANLPIPAVYIIGKDGVIKYKFFDKNYTKRPSVKELLANL